MLLYELTTPVEHKYGGYLTDEESLRCVQQTELLSPRWAPYPRRPARVENICGKFVLRVEGSTAMAAGSGLASSSVCMGGGSSSGLDSSATDSQLLTSPPKYVSCLTQFMDHRLDSVCFRNDSPFGRQFEIFHVAGHVTVRSTPGLPRSVIFKGVKGVDGVRELSNDLLLQPSAVPLVHMGVMSSCLGVRLQTSQCCYLENKISSGIGSMTGNWMRIEPRSMDQCNIVRLSVCKWHNLLPEHLLPTSNDIVITSKGSVMHRMSWPGVEWTTQNEQVVLDVCTWVADQIAASC